jgi:hypothetical protein
MIFEFSVQKTFNQSIDIVDMGNTALRCTNRQLDDYYLIVKTIMGKTHFIKFGPVYPDTEVLLDDFSVSYKKVDYKENVVFREIDKFINDFKKDIENVEEITEYEAWQAFPAVQQMFENI